MALPGSNLPHPLRVLKNISERGVDPEVVFCPMGIDYRSRIASELGSGPYPSLEGLVELYVEPFAPGLSRRVQNTYTLLEIAMRLAFDVFGRRLFREDRHLHERLAHTDIANIPSNLLVLPFPCIYIAFDPVGEWVLNCPETGTHAVDGVYLYASSAKEARGSLSAAFEGAESSICMIVTTRPNENSSNILDDVYHYVPIPIRGDTSVVDALDSVLPYNNRIDDELRANMRGVMLHVAKLLLYCNMTDARNALNAENERDSLLANAGRRKGRKGEKARAKAGRSCNTVRIIAPPMDHGAATAAGTGRSVSPHWRRGHFRHQACGKGRNDRRIVWIPPTLVRGDAITGDGEVRDATDYLIK